MYTISALSAVLVALLLNGLRYVFTRKSRHVEERLAALGGLDKDYGSVNVPVPSEDSGRPVSRPGSKGRRFKLPIFRLPGFMGHRYMERLKLDLVKAGLPLKPEEAVGLGVCLAIAGCLLGLLIFRNLLFALALGVGGSAVPRLWIMLMKSRRSSLIEGQLLNALVMIANSLRAGHSFMQGLELVMRELDPPLGTEFGKLVKECRMGLSLEDALENMVNRVDSKDLELAVTGVLIQRQVGGNLARVLDNIASTIDKRFKTRARIKVATAQGRISALVVTVLPFALGAIAALAAMFSYSVLTFVRLAAGKRRFVVAERLSEIGAMDSLPEEDDDDVLRLPLFERTVKPGLKWIAGRVGQATPAKALKKIEERLIKAGSPRNLKGGDFLTIQAITGLAGLMAGTSLAGVSKVKGARSVLLPVLMAVVGSYAPWLWLSRKVSQRQKEIRQSLPDIMDFLVVCLEAGLSFDLGLMKVVEKFKGVAGDEFGRAIKEIQLGKNRKEALRDMAERVGIDELSFLVNAVLQAEQLGVGMAQVLNIQSDLLRDKRQQHIEEQAMKAPVKMLFPLIFFIFPSIFIVVLGPAILNILVSLAGQ